MLLRPATKDDLFAMTEIYNEIILNSTAIYQYDPQSMETRTEWFNAKQTSGIPVFVAEEDGMVIGFCTYGPFRAWPAYLHTIEHSLYLSPECRGRGIGKLLLQKLIETCREKKLHTMVAGIDADNLQSIGLHEKFGFTRVAHFREVGFKFDRWLDLVFLQLIL